MADNNNNNVNQSSGGGDDDQKKKGKNPASSSSLPPLKVSEPSEEVPVSTTPTSVTPPSVPVTTPPSDPAAPQPSSRRKKPLSTPSKGQGSSSRGVVLPLAPVEERTCPICFRTFDSPQGMRGHSHNHTAEERAMHFGSLNKEERRVKAKYDEWESTNRAIKAATESFTLNVPAKRAANIATNTAISSALTTAVGGSSYSGICEEYGMGKRPRLHLNINEPPPMPAPPQDEVEEGNRNPRRRLLDFDVNEPPPIEDDDEYDDNDQEPPPT